MKMKKFTACLLAALMVLAMTACGGNGNNSSTPAPSGDAGSSTPADQGSTPDEESGTIKIGCLAPLTGEVSVYGIATSNGVKMAVEELNAQGGINGKKIELLIEDE